MPKKLFIVFFFLALILNSSSNSYADFSCSASVSPSSATVGTYTEFSFQINNTGSTEINWVGIRPDENFGLVGFASDWTGELNSGTFYFRGGTISSSDSKSFGVNATAGSNELTANWAIEAAEAYGGEMISCGSVGVVISAYQEPTATPTSVPGATATPTPTSVPGATATPTSAASSSTSTKATPTPTPKPVDKTAPVVSVDTDFSKPFKESSKITGKASDAGAINVGVAKVEYSTDDGKNWQPVDKLESRIKNQESSKTFEFTPASLDDDNYKVKVRATDNSGNVGVSKVYTMVIDRLPPDVGQSFFALGPQPLFPDSNGVITVLAGLDQKITLSLVGGPTEVEISSSNKKFSLSKNTDNGLWSGTLNFEKSGTYTLEVNSLDGAGNTSKRTLHPVTVLPQGVASYNGKPIKDAKITIYYFDLLTKRYVVWDGASYGQNNPQKTNSDGKYSLFMPPGTYYLEIEARAFRTFKTNIFDVSKSMPLNSGFILEKKKGLVFGPFDMSFLDFSVTDGLVSLKSFSSSEDKNQKQDLVGKAIPDADLKNTDNTVFKTSNLSGKITLLSFLSTWDPFTPVQLGILNKVKNQTEASIFAVFSQETASKVYIYRKRGNYDVTFLSDPDGTLIKPLNIETMPFHIFLNRKGVITGIKSGILDEEEILDNL